MRFTKFLALAVLAAAPAMPALAQEHVEREVRVVSHPGMIEGTLLTVAAEGLTQGRPDLAVVSLGVLTEGETAAAAAQANAQRMTALLAAVRRAGVAERDVQTSNLSINPQYVYAENVPPRISGYQANNNVTVKVRNIDTLGRVIDAAVGAGGNNVNGVSFSYQEPDTQTDAARRDAVTEARRIADLYASAAGLRVHRIVSISEGGGTTPPMPMPMMMRMEAADAGATPVAPGEIETRVVVNVVYELR